MLLRRCWAPDDATEDLGALVLGIVAFSAGALLGASYVEHCARPRGYGAIGRMRVEGSGGARIQRGRAWWQENPTAAQVSQWGRPVRIQPVHQEFDRLRAALGACGVPVKTRPMPATEEYILEGLYDPDIGDAGTVLINGALERAEPYGLQVLVHEAAHTLLHNRRCLRNPAPDHVPQEEEAEAVTVWAFERLGLPLETWDGDVIEPGDYRVDLDALRRYFGEDRTRNIEWACDWVVEAARGQQPACGLCPVPQGQLTKRVSDLAGSEFEAKTPVDVAVEGGHPLETDCTPDDPRACELSILLGRMQQLADEAGVAHPEIDALEQAGSATDAEAYAAVEATIARMPPGPIQDEARLWLAAVQEAGGDGADVA